MNPIPIRRQRRRAAFDRYDPRRLSSALRRTKDVRVYRRVQAVLLVCRGYRPEQAGQITGLSRRSVYNAVSRYLRKHDAEVLCEAPRPGRPRVSRAITDARIVREYKRDPLGLGYMATEWTVALLAGHLSKHYACPIAPCTLRRRMKTLGLAWKRPRHSYSTRAPHLPQKKGPLYAV